MALKINNKFTVKWLCAALISGVSVSAGFTPVMAVANPIKESSPEEILEKTGVEMLPFDGAENVSFSMIGDNMGEMNFTYDGKNYFYRAEPTDQTTAYDMSGLYYEWTEEGETQVSYCDAFYKACSDAATLYWLDDGFSVNYTLGCMEYADFGDMLIIAEMCFGSLQNDDIFGDDIALDDDDLGLDLAAPSEIIELFTWKYQDKDTYFRSNGNKTYTFFDADQNGDSIIRFWSANEDSDDTITLYDENDEPCMTMTITDAYEELPLLTDSDGAFLSPSDVIMNGTYQCNMNSAYLENNELILTAELPFYISSKNAAELKVGDVLNNTGFVFMGLEIESIEKKADDLYLINDAFELKYQEDKKVWLLVDEGIQYAQLGVCKLTEDTEILGKDGEAIADFTSYLNQYDFVDASVEVLNGNAVKITVTEAE